MSSFFDQMKEEEKIPVRLKMSEMSRDGSFEIKFN